MCDKEPSSGGPGRGDERKGKVFRRGKEGGSVLPVVELGNGHSFGIGDELVDYPSNV